MPLCERAAAVIADDLAAIGPASPFRAVMRLILFLLPALAMLAACRSQDRLAEDYRAQKSEECVASLSGTAASNVIDTDRFCGCVLDRRMAGKSAAELKAFQPSAAQKQEWAEQCVDASLRPMPVAPTVPSDSAQ
jgi:hypothetical protein